MRNEIDKQLLDTMSKDPGNWKGPFYFNRKDPRLLVPKQHPALGTTFNFASYYAYLTLSAIALIIIMIKLFA